MRAEARPSVERRGLFGQLDARGTAATARPASSSLMSRSPSSHRLRARQEVLRLVGGGPARRRWPGPGWRARPRGHDHADGEAGPPHTHGGRRRSRGRDRRRPRHLHARVVTPAVGPADDQQPRQHGRERHEHEGGEPASARNAASAPPRSAWPASRTPRGASEERGRQLLHRRQQDQAAARQQPGQHQRQVDREEPADAAGAEDPGGVVQPARHSADGDLGGPHRLGAEVHDVGGDQQRRSVW